MSFSDADPGYSLAISGETDPTALHGTSSIADLSSFLNRPVLIKTMSWLENTHFQEFTDVWHELITHPLIANKLKNFGGIRATINIKLELSATPFYAGLLMAKYNVNPGSSISYPVVIGQDQHLVLLSQRPGILLSPQDNMGGQITVPFIYPYNWVCLNKFYQTHAPPHDGGVGTLTIASPTLLKNFSTESSSPVTISMYAWFTDVQLTMNTLNTSVQSSSRKVGFRKKKKGSSRAHLMSMTAPDEYGQGPISGVASAVASAAGALSNLPVIGPYALATQMGAGYLSKVASLFGYTNVPVIEDHKPYAPKPFPNFASAEISHPNDRLSLDPKNELTIDSRVCGLDGSDELSIASFVGREAYLTSFDWGDVAVSEDLLWNSLVTPQLFRIEGDAVYCTPMAYACYLFRHWTGSVEFRFVVQATKFHRGRVRLEYEPLSYTNTPDAQVVNCTKVFDIAESRDFKIRVPYEQLRAWSDVRPLTVADKVEKFGSIFQSNPGDNTSNGMITMRVQNRLTGPSTDNTVSVSVFVRGGDDMAFSNPVAPPKTAYFTPIVQSESMECRNACDMEPYSSDVHWMDETTDVTDKSYSVYMGETVVSFRQLMHRDTFYATYVIHESDQADIDSYELSTLNSIYPRVPGYGYPASLHRDVGETNFNFVSYSPMSWLMPCFGCVRGSVNWTVNTNGESSSISIERSASEREVARAYKIQTIVGTVNARSTMAHTAINQFNNQPLGHSGMILTNQKTAAGISANVPYFSTSRYSYPNPLTINNNISTPEDHLGARQSVMIRTYVGSPNPQEQSVRVDYYVSAGHDFMLCNFKNVPPLYINSDTLPDPSLTL